MSSKSHNRCVCCLLLKFKTVYAYLHLCVLFTDRNHTHVHFAAVVVRQTRLVVENVQLCTALLAHPKALLVWRVSAHLRLDRDCRRAVLQIIAYLELTLLAFEFLHSLSELHGLGDFALVAETLDIHESGADLFVQLEDLLCLKFETKKMC